MTDPYGSFGLFIDGAWRSGSGERVEIESPVTEQVIGGFAGASAQDTQEAIAAAEKGLSAWRRTPAFQRADVLHAIADAMTARADEAARMITLETGKPLAQAGREWSLATDQFRWYAEEARRIYGRVIESRAPGGRFEVLHEPVGVTAAFTAWNFPAALVARKVAPALAAGCSVIARPSRQTPGTAMLLFDCLRAGDLPDGTANLVVGGTAETYGPLMASPVVRKVSLTGSTRVGQQMIRDAAETMKTVSMELGGNAPLIVFEDADLEAVLDVSVPTKYANAGQVCVTPDRFYIHESLHDAFVDGFAAHAAALVLGDGMDEATQMGPLISGRRLQEIETVVEAAVAAGASLVTGGARAPGFNAGHFYQPTVLSNVHDDMAVMAEENFGPVAAVTRFSDAEEVYVRANSSPLGLSAYAFTRDMARARETVSALKAGMVGINSYALAASEAPFGGVGYSGMGREGGSEGIVSFLDTKLAQVAV